MIHFIKRFKWVLFPCLVVGGLSLFNGIIPFQYDNLFYMNAARNLFDHGNYINGFGQIEPHWPIFYSLQLVPSFFVSVPVQIWARGLNLFYFFGGVYFFFLYMRNNNESEQVISYVTMFSLLNYYIWRSVFLEMPDIALFFFFYCFLYISSNMKINISVKATLFGVIALFSILTKPTGLLFILTSLFGVFINVVFYRKNLVQSLAFFGSISLGTFLGKYINNHIVDSLIAKGFSKNPFWESVDGAGNGIQVIITSLINEITSLDFLMSKGNLLSNWIIPSGMFFSLKYIPPVIGFCVVIFLLFKTKKITSKISEGNILSYGAFYIYLALCLVPNIQDRHFILLSPFLFHLFVKHFLSGGESYKRLSKKHKNLIVFTILIFNIIPTLVFLFIGNRKNHGGVYQVLSGHEYYIGEVSEVNYLARNYLSKKIKSPVYVHDNYARFISMKTGINVIRWSERNFNKGDHILTNKVSVKKDQLLLSRSYEKGGFIFGDIK